MIKLKNLTKKYKTNKSELIALDNLSLSFADKGFVSILGPSGCGKTTLLNIIGGLDKKTTGDFHINGTNTEKFKSKDWDKYRNNSIGFVFQSFNLISHINILKNVELALSLSGVKKKEIRKRAKEALDKVGLKGLYYKKPSKLSGGQCQRVAIARAIVNNPNIILADEPTGALDSKTSIEIMEILKELSNERLVIMVTHNVELAEKYSNRIIKLLDGKVVSDSQVYIEEDSKKELKLKNVHMSIFTSLALSFRNLVTKYIRTFLTIFAGSIGIIAVSLVMAVSSGVTKYINQVQSDALSDYPITIRSSSKISSDGTGYLKEYPETSEIYVTRSVTIYETLSNLDQNFLDYVDNLEKDKYTIIDYNRTVTMNVIKKNDSSYTKISTSYLQEMIDSEVFMNDQYELIDGVMPSGYNEVVLMVDKYNSISESVLNSLGIDYNVTSYKSTDLIGMKFKVINNDNYYYQRDDGRFSYKGSSYYDEMYNAEGNIELVITGIVRPRRNNVYSLFDSGILYKKQLTDKVLEMAKSSLIVTEQNKYGLEKDVQTGSPFEDSSSMTSTTTKEYQYQSRMITYGAVAKVTNISVYSDSFEDRAYIEDYIKSYSDFGKSRITYYDYMSNLSKEFSTFIDILTKVLIIFALISLFVSAIMIAIITYISVIERIKEIGILRSLGARKIDITTIFCAETLIIGALSGLLGVIMSFVISKPINTLVQNIIKNNLSNVITVTKENLISFNPLVLMIVVVGSIFVTIVAGLVPSIIASFKKPIDALKNE